MKLRNQRTSGTLQPWSGTRAFTMVEIMLASGIVVMILAAAMSFISFASTTMSGITAQSNINEQAANAISLLQSRARIATSVSNDASGNTVTLTFDDDYNVDSSGDKLAYNDKDHIESFKMVGSSTNLQASTNSFIYIGTNGMQRVLIPTGVCKLPGRNLFTVTNGGTVLIRFGIVDGYSEDRFQAIDIQTAAVLLNRRSLTNYISILP